MTHEHKLGLGTLLRKVILELDGGTQQVYDRRAASFRPRYFPVARQLTEHGPTAVSLLSERLGMTQPAISQTLREMENDGLIALATGEDRRVRLASLTSKGRKVCSELGPVWAAVAQSADEIGSEIGADLPDIFNRLVTALERKPFAARVEEKLA